MGCGSSNNADEMDEDVTKGERLDALPINGDANMASKPKKRKMGKNEEGSRTVDLGGSILEKPGDVRDYYTFDKVLGKGSFGIVHLVYEKKTNLPFACKSISKRKLNTPEDIADVQREIQIMSHLVSSLSYSFHTSADGTC